MALTFPDDMDNLVYMTRRKTDTSSVIMWVNKGLCPKCKKGLIGKPKNPKTGKPKIRSAIYVCDSCDHEEEKESYEETLEACVMYTCPHCQKKGEQKVPYKRKSIKGVKTLRISCEFCGGHIDITKKMKEPKK